MKETARLVLARFLDPLIGTEELSRMLGIKRTRIQQWVHRGHVSLSGPGTGRSILFSPSDITQISAFYHLSELYIPPAKISGILSRQIELLIFEQLNIIAETPNWREINEKYFNEFAIAYGFDMKYESPKRFGIIFRNDFPNEIKSPLAVNSESELCFITMDSINETESYFYSSSFVVIDCKKAAENLVTHFQTIKDLLDTK